jgi:hypothetical protein
VEELRNKYKMLVGKLKHVWPLGRETFIEE